MLVMSCILIGVVTWGVFGVQIQGGGRLSVTFFALKMKVHSMAVGPVVLKNIDLY